VNGALHRRDGRPIAVLALAVPCKRAERRIRIVAAGLITLRRLTASASRGSRHCRRRRRIRCGGSVTSRASGRSSRSSWPPSSSGSRSVASHPSSLASASWSLGRARAARWRSTSWS
jgi:hypothetical protein